MPNFDYKTIRKELLRRQENNTHSHTILEDSSGAVFDRRFRGMVRSIVLNKEGKPNLIIVRSEDKNARVLLEGMFAHLNWGNPLAEWAVELASRGTFVALLDFNHGISGLIPFPQDEVYYVKDSSGIKDSGFGLFDYWFWNGPGTKVSHSDVVCFVNYFLKGDSASSFRPYGDSVLNTEYNLLSMRVKLRTALEDGLRLIAHQHLNMAFSEKGETPSFEVFLDTPAIEDGAIITKPTSGKIRNFDGSEFDLEIPEQKRDYVVDEFDRLELSKKILIATVLAEDLGLIKKTPEENTTKVAETGKETE